MDAVQVQPADSCGNPLAGALAELAGEAVCPPRPDAAPEHGVVYRSMGPVKAFAFVNSFLESHGSERVSEITGMTQRVREFLDQLDMDVSADAVSALGFAANGDTVRLERHDLVVRGPLDFVVIDREPLHEVPGADALGDSDGEQRRPTALIADEEAGRHWRALPVYALRPFTLEACCAAVVPASAATAAARSSDPETEATPADRWACVLLEISATFSPYAGLRVTRQNRRLVRDYREGVRRFLLGVLRFLRSMAVTLLAALSHLALTSTFLLVVIATVRHYGRRGDADGHFLPAPALQGIQRRGAVCLAA